MSRAKVLTVREGSCATRERFAGAEYHGRGRVPSVESVLPILLSDRGDIGVTDASDRLVGIVDRAAVADILADVMPVETGS